MIGKSAKAWTPPAQIKCFGSRGKSTIEDSLRPADILETYSFQLKYGPHLAIRNGPRDREAHLNQPAVVTSFNYAATDLHSGEVNDLIRDQIDLRVGIVVGRQA